MEELKQESLDVKVNIEDLVFSPSESTVENIETQKYEPKIEIKTEKSFGENEGENLGNLSEFIDKKVSYSCKKCNYSCNSQEEVMKHVKKDHQTKKIDKLKENRNTDLKDQKPFSSKRNLCTNVQNANFRFLELVL